MYQVNLRPPEFAKAREFYLPRLLLTLAIILYLAALLSLGGYLHFTRQEVMFRLSAFRTEARLYSHNEKIALEELQKIAELRERKKTLETLAAAEYEWYPHLNLLFEKAGQEIIIDSFSGEAGGSFALSVRMEELAMIVAYVTALENTGEFTGVAFGSISKAAGEMYQLGLTGQAGTPSGED
ncbi:hypothetical protein LR013_00655 [candidate division NPL-UPA2 bacterium]|nr:hypothetical protein [candidate division NPL-UPA2 bacterium]